MEEKNYNTPPSVSNICHACLCQDRNTFPLGEYRDIFARLTFSYISVTSTDVLYHECFVLIQERTPLETSFTRTCVWPLECCEKSTPRAMRRNLLLDSNERNVTMRWIPEHYDNQHTKLCWECMAILRKFYIFKRKCHIAQKILCSEWSHSKPNSLSNLSTTAVNVSYIIINNECNTKSDVKSEATSDHYIKDYDQTFDYLNETEPDYTDSINYDDVTNTVEEPQIQNESDIKHFDDGEIKVDCEFDTFNTKGDNSVVNTESSCQKGVVKVKSEETEEKVTVHVPPNKRRLSRKDIKGHFYVVKKDLKTTGYVKVKIDESKMEKLRHSERVSEFFQKKTYRCDDCISYFPRQKNLSQHKLQVHDESVGKYTCGICCARFAIKGRLAAHVSRHYVALRCATCAFVCYSGQRMRAHVKQHWRSVQCVHCPLSFANIGQFFKHYKESHYVFVCDNCGKRCRSKYTLEKHMRHHYEPNICLICNKVYKTRNSLRNHCELKHERASAGELAYCVQCDKQFENTALYRRHVASSAAHATERGRGRRNKQVRCPLCEKVYSRKTYMMNHYRYVHMKQSKHYCADCDKHFLNRTRYVEHRKYQHEGKLKVKDKMCNICGRGFAANRTLRNHIRTHSGERPYECEHCDASFTQKHCLVSHVKYIHLKNKRRALSSWVK